MKRAEVSTRYQLSYVWTLTLTDNQRVSRLPGLHFLTTFLWDLCVSVHILVWEIFASTKPIWTATSNFLKALKQSYLWKVCQQDFPSQGSVPSIEVELKHEYWLLGSLRTASILGYILISSTELLSSQCSTQDHQASFLAARQPERRQLISFDSNKADKSSKWGIVMPPRGATRVLAATNLTHTCASPSILK